MRLASRRARVVATAGLVTIAASVAVAGVWAASGHQHKSEHWGVITRNTIGSPVADLRDGPYGSFGVTGPAAAPPYGKGSLGIEVADFATLLTSGGPAEKVDFGNEVDFFGDLVSDLNQVGFDVFQTHENTTYGSRNMPNIRLEIDPNVDASNYTTMVWVPDDVPAASENRWSGFIDATSTGGWYFTGTTGVLTGCNQVTFCSFANAKTRLAAENNGTGPATIYTVAVGKGRDHLWAGAVDGLRINDGIYDFEADGVKVKGVKP
jgi:hypothetical protein